MFEFTGLRTIHQDMKSKKEARTTFPFVYNGKNFSCIFITDITPFRLYLTTLGLAPMVFELEIEYGYKVKCYIDDYLKLIDYLEIKYDPNHKFVPVDFFEALNRNIPTNFIRRPNYTETLKIAAKRRIIEEIDKIFFCGWYANPEGRRVRPENLEKTRSAFGDEKANLCLKNNISSRWTDIEAEENLRKLNELM